MTKQEEIRKRVAILTGMVMNYGDSECSQDKIADKILSYLHSQGVVIRVDRVGEDKYFQCWEACPREFVAAESLIEESK